MLRWVCSSLLNPEVSAGPVDKTAEQSPLSYLPKDFAVTFTNIHTRARGFKLHCMSGRRRTEQTNAAEASLCLLVVVWNNGIM
ncbi:hypothetical protein QQF64_031277 [Cirrhinus molitorella]|uniref:Uncharacterized protein n=1 Tax=Cirrhinus molitorella TaxID=172907 RepID=A0ABR3MWG9_9TELE